MMTLLGVMLARWGSRNVDLVLLGEELSLPPVELQPSTMVARKEVPDALDLGNSAVYPCSPISIVKKSLQILRILQMQKLMESLTTQSQTLQ